MTRKRLVLSSLFLIFPFLELSALELLSPQVPAAVEVPAASPAADLESAQARYAEYYSALEVYSDAAYVSPQDSLEFRMVSAAGRYLRAKLEALGAAAAVPAGTFRGGGVVTPNVLAELNEVLGFYPGQPVRSGEIRGVPVKPGYCQINYVKNSSPFLVQYDGFLKKGEVILTFDDGPGPLTEEVSAAMKQGNAPALFFVLGANLGAPGKARLTSEMGDGHSVGVHGYNHATAAGKPFTALSTAETLQQLGAVNSSIASAIGRKSSFFRPPYGIISPEALKAIDSELGLVPVGWTIDTLDWSTKDPEALYQKTISLIKQRGKGIVLMHDIHPQSRTVAKRLVGWLAANGYKVVSPERLEQAFRVNQ